MEEQENLYWRYFNRSSRETRLVAEQIAMGETIPRRNVSFEDGLKYEDLQMAGVDAKVSLPWGDLRIGPNFTNCDGGGGFASSSSRRSIVDSSLSVTPVSQGSLLPLNFLFRHLSGVKSTFAEAMAVAQTFPTPATLSECSSGSKSGTFGRRHSYLKVKHRQRKGTALRAMSSTAIVTSLMQNEMPSRILREAKKRNKHRKRRILGYYDGNHTQEALSCRKGKRGDKNSAARQGRQSRRRKRDGCLIGAVEHKEKLLTCSSRRLVLRKWDVQIALGRLLQLAGQRQSGAFRDITAPKVAESFCYCSDGSWRWRDCVVLGFDSTSGMYRAVCNDTASLSSQNLSGFSTQQISTPLLKSNAGSVEASLDSSPTCRSRHTLMSWSAVEDDIQRVPSRLVARLNIRLPEEHQAPAGLDDGDNCWPSMQSGMQPASIMESSLVWENGAGCRSRGTSLKMLQSPHGLKPEDMPGYCSTLESAQLAQNFNVFSYCGTQASERHGDVGAEANGQSLRQVLKPLQGVESRIGVGLYNLNTHKCFSARGTVSPAKPADVFVSPEECYQANSRISVDVLKGKLKDRFKCTKFMIYDIFPLLSEVAKEFEHEASVTEFSSSGKAGIDYVSKGPRPIRIDGYSFLVHSMKLATSAALLRPGLQSAMLLVVDAVRLLENTSFLAVSVPCVSIGKALALQNNTISESTDYIKKRVLGDAKDALNAALVHDKRLARMENGPNLYIRIARWANILTEAALASALKRSLESYAARFEQTQTTSYGPSSLKGGCYQISGPLFLVKLCLSAEGRLVYRTPLSKLDIFSGKLLDDVVEALLSLPFMDTKNLAQSKIQRDVLLSAADELLPTCRLRVLQAVTHGSQRVDAFHTTLAAHWTDFMISRQRLDAKTIEVAKMCQRLLNIESPSVNATSQNSDPGREFNQVQRHKHIVDSIRGVERAVLNIAQEQGQLLAVLTAAHGEVVGSLFRFDCDEMLRRTTCLGYDCKQRTAKILADILRAICRLLNQRLDVDEALLRGPLSSISPERFADIESVIKCYQADPHPLKEGMEVLHVCHLALESLCLDLSDEDVHAYWSLFARAQNMLVTVSAKRNILISARLNITAGIRAGQSAFLRRATELVASVADIEVLQDPKEAFDNELLAQRILENLQNMSVEVERLGKKEKLLDIYENKECSLILSPAILKMEHITSLWVTIANWIRVKEVWMLQIFHSLNVDNMFVMVQSFADKIAQLADTNSSSISSQEALLSVAEEVNEVLTRLPLLLKLRHPGVRRIHWNELALKTGCRAYHEGAEGLTLKAVLDLPFLRHVVWPVLERAAEEYNQEVCLEKMEEEMRMAELELSPNGENGGRQMLHGSGFVLELLDDQLVAAGCMLHSPFAKALEGPIHAWRDKLQVMLRLLEGLLNFQKWFEILWPIFQSVNIRQQLVDESTKFAQIDVLWRKVLNTIAQRRNFMHLCELNVIFEEVPQYVGTMEGIMFSLINLLEKKRATFPRFFYLSNDELLQVLAHEKSPNEIQYYLCKCFCDLHSISCSDAQVTGMWISRAEYLPFLQPVHTQSKAVEEWMVSVEQGMKCSLNHFILERIKELKTLMTSNALPEKQEALALVRSPKHSHCLLSKSLPPELATRLGQRILKDDQDSSRLGPAKGSIVSQILIIAANVIFCSQVESIFARRGNMMKELQLQLLKVTDEAGEYLTEIRSCAVPETRGTYKSLVLLLIYFREILESLVSSSWIALESFSWQRRLRYYWHDSVDCHARIMNMDRSYGFELINYQDRLVMTALTEKCFLGLLHAFSLGLGGTVTGPAGVGKTDSVKDCAKAVGKHCIVMSCSEEFDYETIGNILKGMASGGLWLCLNEFEYLRAEVASVLSQQLLAIQHAVATKAQRFTYNGVGLPLNKTFAICTTTKPQPMGIHDYVHNTMSSFRSVSMMMPDCCMIVEILLTAEAIANPAAVSQKLILCFRMAGQQLSFKNNHCDFGLRAMRAVIKWVSVLNANSKNEFMDENTLTCKEDRILYEALKQYCLPRLEGEEFVVFSNLLSDLFPQLKSPSSQEKGLIVHINHSLAQHGSTPNSPLLQKCLELHGAMKVHRGVLIVGGAGTGKSQSIFTLAHAINSMKEAEMNCSSAQSRQSITLRVLNPSALSTAHIFGSNNPKTQSWQDGVLPRLLQECETKSEEDASMWMIFDGDMDSVWFDHAITILDDNGHLCLSNGKRILLPSTNRFSVLLEVDDLKCASPGAISRCGIILMDSDNQSYEPLVSSWIKTCPSLQIQHVLHWLFDHFLKPSLRMAMGGSDKLLSCTGLINNFLNLLEATLKLAGIWPDPSLTVREKRPILEISGLQGSKAQIESSSKSEDVFAKSSIEKLGRVKQYISQRQREVRDAVNWRRLHHRRVPAYASQSAQESTNCDQKREPEYCETYYESQVPDSDTSEIQTQRSSVLKTCVGSLFLFGLVWSIGGHLKVKDEYENFDRVLKELALPYADRLGPLPSGSIHDYYYDVDAQTWKRWECLVDEAPSLLAVAPNTTQPSLSFGCGPKVNLSLERGALYVPTAETVRVELLAHILSTFGKPVLLAGAEGTGKTIVGAQLLHQHAATSKCQVVGVTLNSTSCGGTLHDVLRPHLTIWNRRSLMPVVNGRIVVLVDDLHIGQYHARKQASALQFLRFLIEQKGWYGLPMDASFTAVDGLVHLAAASHQTSLEVTSALRRLCRHYFIIDSPDYAPVSLCSIFSAALINNEPPELGYRGNMSDILNLISQASIEVYSLLRFSSPSSSDQLPLLSLHDLFRVRRQLLLNDIKSTTSLDRCFKLWANVFCRTVCDRLWNKVDREVVTSAMHSATKDILNLQSDDQRWYLESLVNVEEQPIFGRYFRHVNQGGVVRSCSNYGEASSREDWECTLQTMLTIYKTEREEESCYNPIVLFPEAISHISRLLNIIRTWEGHALLLGYAGSGRSTLGRLASYILDYHLCEVRVNGNYDVKQWTTDLRNLLKTCGLEEKPIEFLIILEADCVMQQRIMEDLNLIIHCGEALLLLGEVESYYIQQELHRMEGTSVTGREQILGSDREQYLNACFANRLKDNLHVVICAEKIAVHGNSCPVASALVSRHFVVDFYDKWTPAALQTVAKATLTNHQHIRNMEVNDLELLTKACSTIHNTTNKLVSGSLNGSWRLVGMPSYHEMLYMVGRFSARKGLELGRHLQRLETGLEKLQSTRVLVENMQHDLQELLKRKDDANSSMDNLLASIAEEQAQMDKALEEVACDEKVAAEEAETCKKLAQEAQEQVQEVAPEVLVAIKQLTQLNKKDISELKSFTKPPPRLLTVLEALCIILRKEPKQIKHPKNEVVNSYWPVARELLSQVDFVKMLLSFNKDAMENCTMDKLKPYMDNPLFKPEKVRRISVACRSICVWIRAMFNYHYAKTVKMEPRIERLKVANHNLDVCKSNLDEARQKLTVAEKNLVDLRERYTDASSTKDGLARKAGDAEIKLERAVRLIGRLDGECHRWAIQVDDLKIKTKNVIGDAVLASGIVAYLGSFTVVLRSQFVSEWQGSLRAIGLPYSLNFSLVTFYTTPQDIKAWVSAGLPPDDHSVENAIIVCNSSRPLLVLDPQKQVSKWICSTEDPLNFVVVDINSSTVPDASLSCSAAGKVLVVENVGSQTSLGVFKQLASFKRSEQVTNLETANFNQRSPSRKAIQSHCILLLYEQGYNYVDEVNACVNLNVVDFSITFHGLCSQLLSIAAEKERLDLEEERTQLMHQRLLLNCRLQEIEDHLLTLLQGVMVTILDDEALDEALSKATALYADIQAKLMKAAATEEAIELTRKRHFPVAERAAILYSCIADISRVEYLLSFSCNAAVLSVHREAGQVVLQMGCEWISMLESVYQWTLPWFKTVYSTSMQRTSALNPVDFQTRLDYLINKITIAIYKKICSGLLQKHRTLFGLLVVFRLAQTKQDLDREEWIFLLKGESGGSLGAPKEECPRWLDPNSKEWKQIRVLSKYPRFRGLIGDMHQNCWQNFYHSTNLLILQNPWQERLGPFRSLLVLRCLRPDLIIDAVEQLVKDQLHLSKKDLVETSVEDAYEESDTETPVICIFKGVVTPLDEIMTCAKRRNMLKRLWVFSLDQCQGPRILEAIKEAAIWGKWVLLQNCHANIPWINSDLRRTLNDTRTRQVHDSFRLWLTMLPTPGRQPYLLADSVKIVVEPAKGVKGKIIQIFLKELADDFYLGQRQKQKDNFTHEEHSRSLFQLVLFHSLVQERGHFGAMGWNVPMELDHTVFNLAKIELTRFSDHHVSTSENCSLLTSLKEINRRKIRERAKEQNKMDCLLYMMVKVIYGAYVVDNWDEHVMNQLFQHCFKSSADDTGSCGSSLRAYLPDMKGTSQSFLEHARNLPEPDDLEVMGLPKDAVINRAREDTLELFKEALIVETSEESLMSSMSCVFETKKSVILQYFSMIGDSAAKTFPEHNLLLGSQKTMDPFSLLLLQEARRYNHLISTIRTSMAHALKAIEVAGISTPEIEDFCGSIVAGLVPRIWSSKGYASLKSLASWIRDFRKRIEYMTGWFKNGRPREIWASFLFCPQALFAARAQAFARSQKVSVSSISLDIEVMDSKLMEDAGDSCSITGLYIEGARWDRDSHALAEVEPRRLLDKMCPLRLRPQMIDDSLETSADGKKMYCCPIYTTQLRNGLRGCVGCNYIGSVNLPTGNRSPMHWTLRGVAIICDCKD